MKNATSTATDTNTSQLVELLLKFYYEFVVEKVDVRRDQ